jgi:hypothetical protein
VIPALLLVILVPLQSSADPGPAGPGVRAEIDRASRQITITGLDPAAVLQADRDNSFTRWSSLCRVVVNTGSGSKVPESLPIRGSYHVEGVTLTFRSRYPLDQPAYRVVIDPSLLGKEPRKPDAHARSIPLVLELNPDDRARPALPTVVKAIYPSAKVLPENLLRFYLHFSAPMSRGEAYQHIHLLDSSAKPVADAFLEIDEELWSADGRRFTLLFDPGRIKRGLRPEQELGPALRAGNNYTLLIDRQWRDARGNPLKTDFRLSFRAGTPDRSPPSPQGWTIVPPPGGTRSPLEVRFPDSLDEALARRLIKVNDQKGQFVPGHVDLDSAETRWRFTPKSSWKAGEYRLVIGKDLEDPSGNAVGRPFEVDMTGPISEKIEPETVSLGFRIVGPRQTH